jgi:hypothetical protein
VANLDFYATVDDQRDLLDFIFVETDIVIFEFSSLNNKALRTFTARGELERAYCLGEERPTHFQLWSPSVMERPEERRIDMTGLPGRPHRYEPIGAGLMQLYFDCIRKNVLHHSHFGHWSEKGARQRSMHDPDKCDWKALNRISGRIQRQIRGVLSSAKLYSRPVLNHACAALRQGLTLSFGPRAFGASAAEVVEKPSNTSLERTRD